MNYYVLIPRKDEKEISETLLVFSEEKTEKKEEAIMLSYV